MTDVSLEVNPPDSLLLLVGREDFTLPTSLGGATCVATVDCLVVAVQSPYDGPTKVSFAADAPDGSARRHELGSFELESEGLLSLRDAYQRELAAVGVEPGVVPVRVYGDDATQPSELRIVVRPAQA